MGKKEYKSWSLTELKTLKKLHGKYTTYEIAKIMGRSVDSIQGKIRDAGYKLNKQEYIYIQNKTKNTLQGDDAEFVEKNYTTLSSTEMAKKINKTVGQVKYYLAKHKLRRTTEQANNIRRRITKQKGGFKKGHKHIGHAKPIGSIRVSTKGYKMIKYKNHKWKKLHVYLWEQAHGKIPSNCIVVFKDKDKSNVTLDNLECITRAENMKRNLNKSKSLKTFKETVEKERLRMKYGLQRKTNIKL